MSPTLGGSGPARHAASPSLEALRRRPADEGLAGPLPLKVSVPLEEDVGLKESKALRGKMLGVSEMEFHSLLEKFDEYVNYDVDEYLGDSDSLKDF